MGSTLFCLESASKLNTIIIIIIILITIIMIIIIMNG